MAYNHIFTDGTACVRQFAEIAKPYDYALANGIRDIFVPGDLSNVARLDEEYLIALTAFFLKYNEITTHYLVGNHDYARIGKTSVDVLKAFVENRMLRNLVLYFKPEQVVMEKVPITFMPFPYTDLPVEEPTLVFAHVEAPGAMGDNGYPLRVKEDRVQRVDGDFLISGHLHTYQYLKQQRTVFNGSLTQRNFGESLPKGFIVFEARKSEGRIKFRHEFIDSKPGFTFNTVTISSRYDWEKLSDNRSTLYRLFVDDGIIVPTNVTKNYPNIISVYSSSRRKKVEREESSRELNVKDVPRFGPTTGLLELLKKRGLTKRQLILAKGFVKEARQEFGI